MPWGYQWKPYVSAAQRKSQATREMRALEKTGLKIQPIEIEGRKIATTFWGASWCTHLESFSDYENRLPRGRTYVRNGSVCHLAIEGGVVKAIVSGSAIYEVKIDIRQLADEKWAALKKQCTGKIGTLLELLQGQLSDSVMAVVTDRQRGLFPLPTEIKMSCSCPDYAAMCKHIAAVLYGVGARLDREPHLLFLLRGVDHEELILADAAAAVIADGAGQGSSRRRLDESALSDIFGIDVIEQVDGASAATETTVIAGDSHAISVAVSPKLVDKGAASKDTKITGRTVRDLRARLQLSKQQLATLIGVSATSISNWEKERGQLSLSPTSRSSLLAAMSLTEKQAWKKLSRQQY
ncbi:MAG TPA: helix-turn-helix domain-containing protein [Planktothrix sp.]|jgi:uncharacterized Zn finger protein